MTTKNLSRRAISIAPATADLDARTVDVIFATETPVRRTGRGGDYDETLIVSPEAVDLARLNAGASVLNSHADWSLADIIGSVIPGSARIEGRAAVATVRLSDRPEIAGIASDILSGTIRGVSVGYRILSSERLDPEPGTGGVPIVRATRWEPLEISFVPIPADPAAATRSFQQDTSMTSPTFGDAQRRTLALRSGADNTFLARTAGLGEAGFRAALLDHLADKYDTGTIGGQVSAFVGTEHADGIARAAEDALFSRMTGREPIGRARELAGMSLAQIGAQLLEARGEKVNWASRGIVADRVFARSAGLHTTSDFPTLLVAAGRRVLADAYQAAVSPLKLLARQRTATDFRSITVARLSEAPALLPVAEHGEVTRGTMAEAKEAFSVKTFARIFGISRNALINDDLGAFADAARAFGIAAASVEADLLAGLLLANAGAGASLDDGNALFHASRGNRAATGSVITLTSLGAARKGIRDAKGLDGVTPLGLAPRHLLVGTELETAAEQFLADLSPATAADAVPAGLRLALHVEPRLNGSGFRVFADPMAAEVLAYAYLSGAEGPQVSQRDGWDTLGLEIRAVLDFGAGVTGWRGSYWTPAAP